jgi:glycosyltransferase involved in cell wall biosynthesis
VLGHLEGEALWQALQSAVVALWPFEDTPINRARSPVKLLELMAAGQAVVAEDVGEVRALAREATELVPAGSAERFAAAVHRLWAEPGRRAELAKRAVAAAGREHRWSARARTLDRLYRTAHKHRR